MFWQLKEAAVLNRLIFQTDYLQMMSYPPLERQRARAMVRARS